jgi:hypothetical protein
MGKVAVILPQRTVSWLRVHGDRLGDIRYVSAACERLGPEADPTYNDSPRLLHESVRALRERTFVHHVAVCAPESAPDDGNDLQN